MSTYRAIVPTPGSPLIVGHRGASGTAPENTIASFELAVRQGAQILETDVQLSADGELVIVHDDTLARTTDAEERLPDRAPWNVRDLNLTEIRSVTAGEWDGEQQVVPTLAEVLDLVRRNDVGLLIETKTDHTGDALEPALGAAIRELDDWAEWVPARLMVGSFDWSSLQRIRAELPGVHLAFILVYLVADNGKIVDVAPVTPGVVEPGTSLAEVRDRLRAAGVGYLGMVAMGINGEMANDFTTETVEWFRAAGIEINFLTDDADAMRLYRDHGVSSILTNHPERGTELAPNPRSRG